MINNYKLLPNSIAETNYLNEMKSNLTSLLTPKTTDVINSEMSKYSLLASGLAWGVAPHRNFQAQSRLYNEVCDLYDQRYSNRLPILPRNSGMVIAFGFCPSINRNINNHKLIPVRITSRPTSAKRVRTNNNFIKIFREETCSHVFGLKFY